MSARLTDHHFAHRGQPLPPVDESLMLDYALGSNGLFARGRRPGLEVCIPVSKPLVPVKGLGRVLSYVQWGFPKMPAAFLEKMLHVSRLRARDPEGAKEALFHLSFESDHKLAWRPGKKVLNFSEGWHLEYPTQEATPDHVEPTGTGRESEARAIIEIHSHPFGEAYFSPKDDKDESGLSFRIYGVLGRVFDQPAIRVRVGLFGHFMDWQAKEFFELPEDLTDCATENGA